MISVRIPVRMVAVMLFRHVSVSPPLLLPLPLLGWRFVRCYSGSFRMTGLLILQGSVIDVKVMQIVCHIQPFSAFPGLSRPLPGSLDQGSGRPPCQPSAPSAREAARGGHWASTPQSRSSSLGARPSGRSRRAGDGKGIFPQMRSASGRQLGRRCGAGGMACPNRRSKVGHFSSFSAGQFVPLSLFPRRGGPSRGRTPKKGV